MPAKLAFRPQSRTIALEPRILFDGCGVGAGESGRTLITALAGANGLFNIALRALWMPA